MSLWSLIFYSAVPLCLASIPKVTSWSRMAARTLAIRLTFQPLIKEERKQKDTIPPLKILSGSCTQYFCLCLIDQNLNTHGHT